MKGQNQGFVQFKKKIKGKKITQIKRLGKNIILELSGGLSLLIHQKMTGHLMYGQWQKQGKLWVSQQENAIKADPMNRFLHLIFYLDNGYQLALSDVRKFAKIELWETSELASSKVILSLGPDALDSNLSLSVFQKIILNKKGKIKAVLMDQNVIAGIGNIYADEILFQAKVLPQRPIGSLSELEIKQIYQAMRAILKKAVQLRGTSSSDYRDINGEKGNYVKMLKVYRRTNQPCFNCQNKIQRSIIAQRSSHYCPNCQK
ncbi:MAG: bifunctional DNA-formamidopyrimidine glycosylase/DNA-(apurinic or apyrimidinic site) lyase [Candidatus Gribaldobacteria bacterium]|nr:bifunctional DNA-formamidopyrimidine glycosylase/DNA-(apurinic or apyrimidinic site) lyase [Candidatus Gribaldobacteria bacterium]